MKNRRKHFLIDRPLQFRYMGWILLILLIVTVSTVTSLYYGIWGQAVKDFSDESIRNTLKLTTRLYDYEQARFGRPDAGGPRLAYLEETELFSRRQREILHEILAQSNQRLLAFLIPLLVLIAWGTIFLSHKIAGPLYHFTKALKAMKEKDLTVRVRLRKFDEGRHLAQGLNAALAELDRSIARLKKASRDKEIPSKLRNDLSRELSAFKTTED